ncbi:MAG TPA: PhzF family phenazine biosynthesis protein [Rhizomicrobium sp.]|jgi:PhzF family phenazine biosynthesis protein|nr:PhzF family phenazine biosynthesis protein [Rhizomicrobium sp.]
MKLRLWQIDAFAEKPFEGNPAAVVPLESWPADTLMQRIANENNLAETAFIVREGHGRYGLRWFTPTTEVDLCGHATFASAWLLFAELEPALDSVSFETRSGTLTVERGAEARHSMSLPSDMVAPLNDPELAAEIGDAFGIQPPAEVHTGRNLLAVFRDASEIRRIKGPGVVAPIIPSDKGLIVTAAGDDGYDFISRYFAPHHGVAEDPVTGSAHCALTPFWAKRLDKKTLRARQVSPRGGDLTCTDAGTCTILSGTCALYLRGEIEI